MFYLSSRVDVEVLGGYIRVFIFEDEDMLENSVTDVERRLARIFSNRKFMKGMANPDNAWLDVPVETVTGTLLGFFKKLQTKGLRCGRHLAYFIHRRHGEM